jgi:hypothetical protein
MTRLAILLLGVMLAAAYSADSLRTMDGSANVAWSTLKPGPYRVTEALLLEPAGAGLQTSSITYHTKRHGTVDLDDLLDRIDSVLAGEHRK